MHASGRKATHVRPRLRWFMQVGCSVSRVEAKPAHVAILEGCRARQLPVDETYQEAQDRRCSNRLCTTLTCFSEARVKSRKCSGCRIARYCSVACQKQHWGVGTSRAVSLFRRRGRDGALRQQQQQRCDMQRGRIFPSFQTFRYPFVYTDACDCVAVPAAQDFLKRIYL